jgi:hypothetical protein
MNAKILNSGHRRSLSHSLSRSLRLRSRQYCGVAWSCLKHQASVASKSDVSPTLDPPFVDRNRCSVVTDSRSDISLWQSVPMINPITPRLLEATASFPNPPPAPSPLSTSSGRAASTSSVKGTRSLPAALVLPGLLNRAQACLEQTNLRR